MTLQQDNKQQDNRYMTLALGLARRGLGNVWPNPAVGCVLVKANRILARGWTQPGGRPHAEAEALSRAGAAARGATAYVTLEPCAHYGKTPPCAQALIDAGVKRVVIATGDPDARVAGAGAEMLRRAGLEVSDGIQAEQARILNQGFFTKVTAQRPMVTLKLAGSLDGRIATATGDSQWITGEPARQHGHLLRASHDAIMVGHGTLRADDPSLTCRLPGLESHSPVRVVVAGDAAKLPASQLIASAPHPPVWVLCRDYPASQSNLNQVEIISVGGAHDGGVDLVKGLEALAERGITRLLVEGGARLSAALLRAGLIDRLYCYRAAIVIGGDGLPALASTGVKKLVQAANFEWLSSREVGLDRLDIYRSRRDMLDS